MMKKEKKLQTLKNLKTIHMLQTKQGANICHYNKLMMINEDEQDANK